jgi:nucleotide-binding universal stress UspA family protein
MIAQIKKILYATDLMKNSLYPFYFAVDLARKHGASIIILHCVEKLSPSLYAEGGMTSNLIEAFQNGKEQEEKKDTAMIKKHLQEFCKNMDSQIGSPCVDLVSEIIVNEGYPVNEILTTADTKECDVIVLGTHGKGWLKHTFLGSVARSVLERTRKPVFIIPLPSEKSGIETGAL